MKKLWLGVGVILLSFNAGAEEFWPIDVYRVNCKPALNEFSVEAIEVIWQNNKHWEKEISDNGLYVLNKHYFNAPAPIEREEICEINDVVYKMKFIPKKSSLVDGKINMSVQFFAQNQFVGDLSFEGDDTRYFFDGTGIKNGKMFVRGYVTKEADNQHNIYIYREVSLPTNKTYYHLNNLSLTKSVEQEYNVAKLQCYPNGLLSMGVVDFDYYEQDAKLPENYYRFADKASFACGQMKFKLGENGVIHITHNHQTEAIKLVNCYKKLKQLRFDLRKNDFDLGITYYDTANKTWGGTYCYKNCLSCDIYH